MLQFYDHKYGDLDEKMYHLIRSFDYFADAETEKLPKILIDASWIEVKKFFHRESMRLSKSHLGLKKYFKQIYLRVGKNRGSTPKGTLKGIR